MNVAIIDGSIVRWISLLLSLILLTLLQNKAVYAVSDPIWVKPRVFVSQASSKSPEVKSKEHLTSDQSVRHGVHIRLEHLTEERDSELLDQPSTGPTKIGFSREVDALSTSAQVSSGLEWVATPNGALVGHFSVRSPEAAALRLGLRFDKLPQGAEFRFHDETLNQVEKVTAADIQRILTLNRDSGDNSQEASVYWSPVIVGDYIGFEVTLPKDLPADTVELKAGVISHLTVNPGRSDAPVLKPRAAASCNLDARCYPDWSAQTNAVARITFVSGASSFMCTGTLLNDTAKSNTPYFLTANHCISSQTIASTITSFWFFYSSACDSNLVYDGTTRVSGGGTLLYNSSTTDASFLKLNGALPSGVTFSGWTTSTPGLGLKATGLHNPTGDLQKISFWLTDQYENCVAAAGGTYTCKPTNASGATYVNVLQVSGTTEGGSSGSGIFFDNNQYLFGQLYGGDASCANPNGSTEYGLFSKTYVNGNLSQYLAPGKQVQTISLVVDPVRIAFGQSATITASASSGLSVTLESATPGICAVTETTVTGVSPGVCTIRAGQAGNITYESATSTANITITKASQTIALAVTPPFIAFNQSATITASASSGLPVVLVSTTPAICSVVDVTVTGISPGSCTIRATQAGDRYYEGVTSTVISIITRASQTVSLSLPSNLVWGKAVVIDATSSLGLPLTQSSTTPMNCAVRDNTVLVALYPGVCTVVAFQPGNAPFSSASTQSSTEISLPVYPGPTRNLTIKVLGKGVVSSEPIGIGCGQYCSLPFTRGSIVTLTANPADGQLFDGWSGACFGKKPICKLKLTGNKFARARFK